MPRPYPYKTPFTPRETLNVKRLIRPRRGRINLLPQKNLFESGAVILSLQTDFHHPCGNLYARIEIQFVEHARNIGLDRLHLYTH